MFLEGHIDNQSLSYIGLICDTMTFSIMTLSITTLSIKTTTFSIINLIVRLSLKDTLHDDTQTKAKELNVAIAFLEYSF
jgi:hypothetical protein